MKTNHHWTVILWLALPVSVLCGTTLGQNSTASELLQKGIYLQETVGDVDGAIKIYRQVARMAEESRANAAQAEYRLGVCLQKKGQQEQALETFRKVIREYPEQSTIVNQARELVAKATAITIKDNPCQSQEDELKGDSGNFALRKKILDCYFRAELKSHGDSERSKALANARAEHVFWFTQHASEYDENLGTSASVEPFFDPENYVRLKRAWMSQIEIHPGNTNALINAARFMRFHDKDEGLNLASKAHAIDPKNVRATRFLAELYEGKMHDAKPELKTQLAQQALQLREQEIEAAEPASAGSSLKHSLAVDAFESGDNTKAQKYAEELLQLASPQNEKEWYYGNALHDGNLILGRIALKNGNLEEAKNRLLAAGTTPGSPQLDSFGPNMMLAKELLEKGQQDVVLRYFDECSVFWENSKDKLDQWRAAVRAGSIPNFGANLVY